MLKALIANVLWSIDLVRLMPLPIVAAILRKEPLGTYEGVPRFTYRWWPFRGYHVACGTVILHPPHKRNPSQRLLDHEMQHIRDQKRFSGVGWLIWYGLEWLIRFLFVPRSFLDWHQAYLDLWLEVRARRASNDAAARRAAKKVL